MDNKKLKSYYKSFNNDFVLFNDDSLDLLDKLDFKFNMIFADPPYFLSNGGISIQSGEIVSVDKGEWDKAAVLGDMDEFNFKWISKCREKLTSDGSIWISGTYHNIFSIATILTALKFKILNMITWVKTNAPPNISCRYFKHSTEFIIWARKEAKVPHRFNYGLMKQINDDKQMTDVWRFPAIAPWEKSCGKHPTQKPLNLLTRIILSCTKPGDWILDPFAGSSTTGIAANLCGRNFVGIEKEIDFANISMNRRIEIDNPLIRNAYTLKINDLKFIPSLGVSMVSENPESYEC